MKDEFENILCSVPQFIYLVFKTIKSSFVVLFFIFCLLFFCSLNLIKPLNTIIDKTIEYRVIDKISSSISDIKNNNNNPMMKNVTKILSSYVNQSDIDLNTLNDYLNSNLSSGQFDEESLKKLINSHLVNGVISSDDLNNLLESNTTNKAKKPSNSPQSDKNIKDTYNKSDASLEKSKSKFNLSSLILPFISIILCAVFTTMIGYIVNCYADDIDIDIREMAEISFKRIFQICMFYIIVILSFVFLVFLLNVFITGNKMFFNIVFAFLTVVIVLVILAYFILCIRFSFALPLIGLFDIDFLKSLVESLNLTKRFSLSSILRSLVCILLCSSVYFVVYLLFHKHNSSFLFAFTLSVLVIFSSIYHSLLALNLSCLLNPKQYDFDEIVNDYCMYEPEKAEILWSDESDDYNKVYDDEDEFIDLTNSKSVYVNLSILKDSIDCVNKNHSNEFIS